MEENTMLIVAIRRFLTVAGKNKVEMEFWVLVSARRASSHTHAYTVIVPSQGAGPPSKESNTVDDEC